MMHAAMIHGALLEERHRSGLDKLDEVWEGVLHLVPPASFRHQDIEDRLRDTLKVIALPRGLRVFSQTGLFDPAVPGFDSYRIPDIVVFSESLASARGIEGPAALAIEIVSPHDESREKLPFYARVGVREVWLLDPNKLTIEVFAGTRPIAPVGDSVAAPSLGLVLRIDRSKLRIRDAADTYAVDL